MLPNHFLEGLPNLIVSALCLVGVKIIEYNGKIPVVPHPK